MKILNASFLIIAFLAVLFFQKAGTVLAGDELREVIVSHTDEKGVLQLYRMNEDGTNATWTSDLSDAVIFANEQVSKRLTAIPLDDDIYEWINNVTGQTSGTFTSTAQNVPLRTSLYSLAFPVHPFVLRHVRVLRNYLSSEHDVDNLAELILAMAFRYRNFPSILNATSDILNDQIQDDDELYLQCKLASALRGEGGISGSAKFQRHTIPNRVLLPLSIIF